MRSETGLTTVTAIRVTDDQRVDARELHSFLKVETRFNDWIKRRIEDCRLVTMQDYWLLKNEYNNYKHIHLSLDACKMISMMERSDAGDSARRYFIEVERRFVRAKEELLPRLREEIERLRRELMISKSPPPPKHLRASLKNHVCVPHVVVQRCFFGLPPVETIAWTWVRENEVTEQERLMARRYHKNVTALGIQESIQRDDAEMLFLQLPAPVRVQLRQ